jgi:protein phosphatase
MGSRAIVIVGRSAAAVRQRFGFLAPHEVGLGIVYTRTGRRFFEDQSIENGILEHLLEVLSVSGFWENFQTDWVCLDTELMPWSVQVEEASQSASPTAFAHELSRECSASRLLHPYRSEYRYQP